jgi:hypothetical protein
VRPEALARVALATEAGPALEAVPAAPGVGQLLGPEGQSLLIGTAANLRRWTASHLGLARPRPAVAGRERRPKTSLAGIATAVAWIETDGPFRQRLAYERLAATLVPASARRDLKPPAFLHLDPAERFPRVTVRAAGEQALFGPFRDRRAAEKAKSALQRLFPLRPCDYNFEPDAALPLGLACLYAQVRSCAAPCLMRASETDYRALAASAAGWLADPSRREGAAPLVPATVAAASGRAVIVDRGKRSVGLYPVRGGSVLDAAALVVPLGGPELEAASLRLFWPETGAASDWPWLTAWLRSPKARASFVVVRDSWSAPELGAALRAALPRASADPALGDNLGTTREEA